MKIEPKLKAGDTVYILDAEDHVGVYRSGTIYSISRVDYGDNSYVIFGDNDDWWYFDDNELELVHSVILNEEVTLDGFGL